MRQNLPLSTALLTDANGSKGNSRRVMTRISERLAQGLPLSEALRQGFPKCPGDALAMVTSGEKIQQLPKTIAKIEEGIQAIAQEDCKIHPVNPLYAIGVVVFAMVLLSGLLIFVIPKFSMIFSDIDRKSVV